MQQAEVQPPMQPDDTEDIPRTARILLVDDDERNLLALGHVLRDIAEVVTASSGREALRHLLDGEFAVILLDVFMPDMDGYEVADLIRERKQTARIPIILLSAVNKETEHLMRGYAMGAVDYVFKPVDPVVLATKVSVFVELFEMRKRVEAKSRAERELREAGFRAQLERLQIEHELNSTRARQATVLDALPLALFEAVADKNGMLIREFVAGDLAKIAGVDATSIAQRSLCWEDRIHPEDLPATRPPAGSDAVFSTEYRWNCADGSQRYFFERAVPIGCEADGLVRWAGTLLDVTDRRKLEAQLLQAGKMDALGRLTGGVAHDFNNVLAAVLGGITLLERKAPLDDLGHRLTEQIRLAAERGAELVRRMMAFARKQELKPVYLAPSAVREAVSGLVEQTLGGTVTLSWDCADTDLVFHADRSQLELALVNLVINARDAMPEGGSIHVAIAPAADADRLRIEVRDEGTGIAPAVLERITEPFFTTKGVGKGTGLGLSMVMGFVQQSGGTLDIESAEGCGTTVRILMPAARAPDADEREAPSVEGTRAYAVRTVLVVDDDHSVRTIIAEQLREFGVMVEEAASGADAVERVISAKTPFDLLLTDFAMPGLNGLQTIERLRALGTDIPCALMTGYADDRIDTTGGTQTRLLRKPIAFEDLEDLLIHPT